MRNFALRAAALLGGHSVALRVQSADPETILMSGADQVGDVQLLRSFNQALTAALPKYPADVAFAPASEMLGSPRRHPGMDRLHPGAALSGSSGELLGVLCFA